jgi:hypothetical protein
MPNLRPGERMQRCEHESHDMRRRQKYYVVRKYYNELENHFCAGCLNFLEHAGLVSYSIDDGYTPTNMPVASILQLWSRKAKNGR